MAAKKTRPKTARKAAGPALAPTDPEHPPSETRTTLSAVPRPLKKKASLPPVAEAPAPEPAEPQEQAGSQPIPAEALAGPEPEPVAESAEVAAAPLPPAGRGDAGSLMKGFAVLALLCAAAFLAYYFISLPENSFVPGAKVDAETFKNIFLGANSVYIVMDVRGAGTSAVSNNILQCGVDFAASSGMGGKIVTPLSFGPEGCVAPDGMHAPKECFAMLKRGITVYVKEGPGEVAYYTNGMVVPVGTEYSYGTCGIKRT